MLLKLLHHAARIDPATAACCQHQLANPLQDKPKGGEQEEVYQDDKDDPFSAVSLVYLPQSGQDEGRHEGCLNVWPHDKKPFFPCQAGIRAGPRSEAGERNHDLRAAWKFKCCCWRYFFVIIALAMETMTTAKRRTALTALLKDIDEDVRLAAANALERLEGIGSLDEVLELLKKGDHATRVKAIYALGQIGGERVLSPLLYCIARPEEDIRSAAIEVLGRLAYPGAKGPLVEKLKDPSPAIQSQVIAALGNFRDPSLIPLLVPFLDAGDGLLDAETVLALGKIGAAECEEKFISLLHSPHTTTRQAAALALGELPVI